MRTHLFLSRTWFAAKLGQRLPIALLIAVAAVIAVPANAQQPGNQPNAFQNPLAAPVNGPQNAALVPGGNATVGTNGNNPRGGAANADFDSLIDLIVSTVQTETWAENGGGEAEIRPFPGGVLVDAAGTLRLKSRAATTGKNGLAELRGAVPPSASPQAADARRASQLRYISLPRLEREIARRQAARKPLDAEMLTLAGLAASALRFCLSRIGRSRIGRSRRRLARRCRRPHSFRRHRRSGRAPGRFARALASRQRGGRQPLWLLDQSAAGFAGENSSVSGLDQPAAIAAGPAQSLARHTCAIPSACRTSKCSASTRPAEWPVSWWKPTIT